MAQPVPWSTGLLSDPQAQYSSQESPTQHPQSWDPGQQALTFWVMLSSSPMSSLRTVKGGREAGEARPPKQVRAMTKVNQSAMEPRASTEQPEADT